ncbi:MAG: ATP-binding protein [Planctomycetota bacterium]
MGQLFPRVVGHQGAKEDLRRALEGGRLAGSFLFLGPEGVGRRLLALELAKAAVCQGPAQGPRPCGECGFCKRIERGNCGDVVVLQRPEELTKIPIDTVREMIEELGLAPVECPLRFFVIDGAGDLMEETQNALLKALEEPPPQAVLVLIAERADEVLPTIASRCRVVRLGELSRPEVCEVLRRAGAPAREVEARARWSSGSPGRGLREDALELAEAAREAVALLASGKARRDPMAAVERLAAFVQPGKGESRQQRERVAALAGALQRVLRDALVLRAGAGGAGGAPGLSGAERGELEALARLPEGRLERALDELARVDEELARNANVKLLVDGLGLELGRALAPAQPEEVGRG